MGSATTVVILLLSEVAHVLVPNDDADVEAQVEVAGAVDCIEAIVPAVVVAVADIVEGVNDDEVVVV